MNQLSLRQPCKGHNSARNKFLSLNESLGFETETRYSRRSNFFCNMLRAINSDVMICTTKFNNTICWHRNLAQS